VDRLDDRIGRADVTPQPELVDGDRQLLLMFTSAGGGQDLRGFTAAQFADGAPFQRVLPALFPGAAPVTGATGRVVDFAALLAPVSHDDRRSTLPSSTATGGGPGGIRSSSTPLF
jgi:hypothetical protein